MEIQLNNGTEGNMHVCKQLKQIGYFMIFTRTYNCEHDGIPKTLHIWRIERKVTIWEIVWNSDTNAPTLISTMVLKEQDITYAFKCIDKIQPCHGSRVLLQSEGIDTPWNFYEFQGKASWTQITENFKHLPNTPNPTNVSALISPKAFLILAKSLMCEKVSAIEVV